ncbi:peptidoglycan-binding protein, partial [Bacillus sp. JJ1521]|uniref:peptidoglycan-binding protein n=1 Tax=Bacillus sp. JJ1521 TaxID=3122957 RepID=UPI003F68B399
MNFKKYLMFPIVLIMFVSVFIGGTTNNVQAFSEQTIQRGATGDDVIELQSRLQYNGYYHGTIDGVYGWSTYWAVRNFQKSFGLEEVDGLVGDKTKAMINRFTKYNKQFVHNNLRKGNRFTHYGGVPWSIQSAPSEQNIQKAKTTAEARRTEIEKQFTAEQKQPQAKAPAAQPKQPQA